VPTSNVCGAEGETETGLAQQQGSDNTSKSNKSKSKKNKSVTRGAKGKKKGTAAKPKLKLPYTGSLLLMIPANIYQVKRNQTIYATLARTLQHLSHTRTFVC
jgi:hypothetical protein